jgi:hypothetical protein
LHLQQYPHYYAEFTAYRKSLWQNLKTGNITLREIGYVLQTTFTWVKPLEGVICSDIRARK